VVCSCHPHSSALSCRHVPSTQLHSTNLPVQARMLLASTSEIYGDPEVGPSPFCTCIADALLQLDSCFCYLALLGSTGAGAGCVSVCVCVICRSHRQSSDLRTKGGIDAALRREKSDRKSSKETHTDTHTDLMFSATRRLLLSK
jgi:hypothetical protein